MNRTEAFFEVSADLLKRGHRVRFQACGQSMYPTIKDGEKVTVEPVCTSNIRLGDIVLYHRKGRVMAHRVVNRKRTSDGEILILRGDASMKGNEPVSSEKVLGKVVAVERDSRCVKLDSWTAKALYSVFRRLKNIRNIIRMGGAKMSFSTLRSKMLLLALILGVIWIAVGGPFVKVVQTQGDLICYTVADNGSTTDETLVRVNVTQGTNTVVGTVNSFDEEVQGSAIQPVSGTMFGADDNRLGRINLTTGAWDVSGLATSFGTGGGSAGTITFNTVFGLTFDPTNGRMYGISNSTTFGMGDTRGALFQINPNTGTAVVDAFGTNEYVVIDLGDDASDLAIDPEDGQMYMCTDTQLFRIDKTTGADTLVASFDPPFSANAGMDGLTFADNGNLYGVTGPSTPGESRFWFINKNTADATELQVLPSSANDYDSCACQLSLTMAVVLSFKARKSQDQVLLEWGTESEVDNLGFNIYREEKGKLNRLTQSPVAGSALLAGPKTPLTAGVDYAWKDTVSKNSSDVKYWLEDIDLNGTRTMHGPISPVESTRLPTYNRSPLLSQVGRIEPRGATASEVGSAREIETPATMSEERRAKGIGPERSGSPPSALRPPPAVSASDSQLQTQWALAAQSAVKLLIRGPGWYRARQPELIAAGLDPAIDPRRLQLFVNGQQIPVIVSGEEDGRFDSTDSVEFYGVGVDTPWTDARVYWLVQGAEPGQRIAVLEGNRGQPTSARSFPFTVERKDRTVYFAALKNGEAENFFGPVVGTEEVHQTLTVRDLDPSPPGEAVLEVSLQGITDVPAQDPDHQVRIDLNGLKIGEMAFNGQALAVHEIRIPQQRLRQGPNTVTLKAIGGEGDFSLVDHVRLTYWRTYTADKDALWFTAQGGEQINIKGFTKPLVRVVDVTNPDAVNELVAVAQPDETRYAITVAVPGSERRTLLAFTEDQIESVAEIKANQPSRWHDAVNRADIVMISHRSFVQSLLPLKSLRESQGWSVAVVDVEDVYDEFGFGEKGHRALREFLRRAKTAWPVSPRFVLLVGDASLDPRNYLRRGDFDFVPTAPISTVVLETGSDDWFADFDEDGVPEMAVGRLPVRTAREAAGVVAKLIAYERSGGSTAWAKRVLVVTDNNDSTDFETASAQLQALLPTDLSVDEISLNRMDAEIAREALLRSFLQGQLVINYIGHGSFEVWAAEQLLKTGDAQLLRNGARLPFVVSMTCLTGFFNDVYTESIAEALLKTDTGGAVAVWASSTITVPGGQNALNQALVQHLFQDRKLTLGEAVMKAKAAVADGEVRRSWVFFGDPATRLK
jgi:signal peptidase I